MSFSPIVSFIVAVYNAEKYIEKCVNSIINQSYRDIEVLLMLDGPTDRSPEICAALAASDNRIKVINNDNKGCAHERNEGVGLATGEYVIFVDHDDFFLCDDGLTKIMKAIHSADNPDVLIYKPVSYYQKSEQFKYHPDFPAKSVVSSDKLSILEGIIRSGSFPVSAWDKIIRRDFLVQNNIFFADVYPGDVSWAIDLFIKADMIKVLNVNFYAYRRQVEGADTATFTEKKYLMFYSLIDTKAGEIRKGEMPEKLKTLLLSFLAYQLVLLWGLTANFRKFKFRLYLHHVRELKWLLKYDLNPKVRKVKYLNYLIGTRFTCFVLKRYMRFVNKS